jgi:hypothetical protein
MAEPTNAEIMVELKGLGGLVRTLDRRLKAVEADLAVLRSAYANQGKSLGDLLRSTPLPPPEPEKDLEPIYEDEEDEDEDDTDGDTNPSIEAMPADFKKQ